MMIVTERILSTDKALRIEAAGRDMRMATLERSSVERFLVGTTERKSGETSAMAT